MTTAETPSGGMTPGWASLPHSAQVKALPGWASLPHPAQVKALPVSSSVLSVSSSVTSAGIFLNKVLQCAKIGFCLDIEWLNRHKIGKREESLRRIGCHLTPKFSHPSSLKF